MQVLLNDGDTLGAGFFLQQALEKFLKAFLLARGWKLKRTHTLHSLLDEAAQFDGALEPFRGLCERVSGYYVAGGYPIIGNAVLRTEDLMRDLIDSRGLVAALFPNETLE